MPRRPSFETLVLLEVTVTQPFAEACVPNGEPRPYICVHDCRRCGTWKDFRQLTSN